MDILLYVSLIGLGVIAFGFVLSAALSIADRYKRSRSAEKQAPERVRYIEIPESDFIRTEIYTAAQNAASHGERDNQ